MRSISPLNPLFWCGVLVFTAALGACGEEEDSGPLSSIVQPPSFGQDGGSTQQGDGGGQGDGGSPWVRPEAEPGLPELTLGNLAGSGTNPTGGIWDRWDLEIAGIWVSSFGEAQTITTLRWNEEQDIVTWDNDKNSVVTQNSLDAPYYPGAYNRIVWTEQDDDGFWYCTVDFGVESLEQVQAFDKIPDDTDPALSGCGGFAWTRLERSIEAAGHWVSASEGSLLITPEIWGENSIEFFSNKQNWAITRNPPDAYYYPDYYNKVLWTHAGDGTLLVCVIDRELKTLEEVVESEYLANATDPDFTGCRGEPWEQWTPVGPEISGDWEGEWGPLEVSWAKWGGTEMVLFDNDENWAITRNGDDETWNPGTYTRRLWTQPVEDTWYTCDGAFGLASLEEAALAQWSANPDDLESGCGDGGLPWSMYWVAPIEVRGSWAGASGTEDITNDQWAGRTVISFDNLTNRAIVQSPPDAEWNADKYARFLWTEPEDGEFHYCEDVYGKSKADDISTMIDTADATDLETGCGGFPWTHLSPAGLELTGVWANDVGNVEIVDGHWGARAVYSYDNLTNEAILLNAPDAAVEPSTYLRVQWTTIADDAFYACTESSNHPTPEEAADAPDVADPLDVTGGCAGGPWTKHWLAPIELEGSWTVNAETVIIGVTTWGADTIQSYDNLTNRAVLQLGLQEDGTSGLYARRVWTDPVGGIVLVCEDVTAQLTLEDVEAAPIQADPQDQSTGCGESGGPWIIMAQQ